MAALAAGVPVVVGLLTADQAKWWHWTLGATAAALAGGVSWAASRAEGKRERQLAHAVTAAEDVKASVAPVTEALKEQLKTAEAQRATTANVMVGLAGALERVMAARTADADNEFNYARSLVLSVHKVLQPTAGLVRVAYLARRSEPSGPLYRVRETAGHQGDVRWEIARGTADGTVAEIFSGPPWNGALLIDDRGKEGYADAGALVLCPPEADVRCYCRAEVRYGERKFGLLCVDAWAERQLTAADREVIVAFGALLAIGLELGDPAG